MNLFYSSKSVLTTFLLWKMKKSPCRNTPTGVKKKENEFF